MKAVSTAAKTTRRVTAGIAEASLLLAVVAMLAICTALATGSAPPGANSALAKGGPHAAGATSSIKLLEEGQQLKFGSAVTFEVSAAGLQGPEYPMVYVECYSDVAGSAYYGQLVYGQLDHPDAVFVLGGGWSLWWEAKGSAACDAILYAYGGKTKAGVDTIRQLAGPIVFYAS